MSHRIPCVTQRNEWVWWKIHFGRKLFQIKTEKAFSRFCSFNLRTKGMAASLEAVFLKELCGRKVFEPEPYDKTEIGGLASAAHFLESSKTSSPVTEV